MKKVLSFILQKERIMFKKCLSFALIVLLLNAVGVSSVYADTKEEKEARFTERVRENINKLGTGTDARVEVKLRNKTKLKGYISQINENSFVVVEENTKISTEVPYSQAKQVKGNNLSNGAKLAIGIGLLVGFTVILIIAGRS